MSHIPNEIYDSRTLIKGIFDGIPWPGETRRILYFDLYYMVISLGMNTNVQHK